MNDRRSALMELITDTAITLFKRDGYENTSVNAICKHANINRSSFYNIFSDKEDIIIHIFSISQNGFEGMLGQLFSAKNDFERMWLICESQLTKLLNLGPEITSALFRIALIRHTDFMAMQSNLNESVLKLYKNCLAQGIASNDAYPEELVSLVTQAVNYIAYDWCCTNGAYDLKKRARRAAEVLYGIAPEYCWEPETNEDPI